MGEFEVYLIALCVLFLPVAFPGRRLFWLVAIPVFAAYIVVSRYSGFDTDVAKFAEWMKRDFSGFFALREMVYFTLSHGAYLLTKDERLAFLLMDAGWILLAAISLRMRFGKSNLQYAAFAIILMSFPVLMGFQNFYRQHIGIGFIMLAYHAAPGRVVLPSLSFLLGIFSHNSAALTAPAIFLRTKFFKDAPLVFLIFFGVTISAVLGLGLISSGAVSALSKSNATTGLDMSLVYLALFIVFFVYFLYAEKGNVVRAANASPACFSALFITPGMIAFFADAPAERTAMIFLILMIPDLVESFGRFGRWERFLLLAVLFLMLSLPMIAFPNTRNFVM
ncbi:hypothetical protein [Parvularcula marina]|uniref:EpsG family protein n=1 Tax=Parvularcula marina TaxID=2292771 RepID=A0A371RL18_9PROT|nr:hypothetical protein [Parvularcula marina]RFB06150.1 hypothetical protein DX908_13265 [Parvularcula marina]